MKSLGILGASRFGELVADLAHNAGGFDRVVFFDDFAEPDGERIVGKLADVESAAAKGRITELAIAVGYRHFEFRKGLYEQHAGRIPFATLVHPSASISDDATLGEGAMIFSMSNVEMGAVLAPNVTVFNQCSISHDVEVGAHSFFSVGVSMGGGVKFGSRTYVGVGALIANDISIGEDCFVSGGTFLTKSIENDTCVIGNPFKVIERTEL